MKINEFYSFTTEEDSFPSHNSLVDSHPGLIILLREGEAGYESGSNSLIRGAFRGEKNFSPSNFFLQIPTCRFERGYIW